MAESPFLLLCGGRTRFDGNGISSSGGGGGIFHLNGGVSASLKFDRGIPYLRCRVLLCCRIIWIQLDGFLWNGHSRCYIGLNSS